MPQTIAPISAPVMPTRPPAHSQTTAADGDFAAVFHGHIPAKQAATQKSPSLGKQAAEKRQETQNPSQTGIGAASVAAGNNLQEASTIDEHSSAFPAGFAQHIAGDGAAGKRPVAVVIENNILARPQWGLSTPDILIEGLAEGGISRMLALYSDIESAPKLGPVRSARIDFIELAQGFDAIYAHWGQSDSAKEMIAKYKIDELNGETDSGGVGSTFKRDTSRDTALEHTGYTTGALLKKAIDKASFRKTIKSGYGSLLSFEPQSSPAAPGGGACASISFSYSSSYAHEFKYDAENKVYLDFMGSSPMKDGNNGKQYAPVNVVILYANVPLLKGSKELVDMDLSSGSGIYASNGAYQKIKWQKGSMYQPLKLMNEAGEPLKLNAGRSYIGIVPAGRAGSTKIK